MEERNVRREVRAAVRILRSGRLHVSVEKGEWEMVRRTARGEVLDERHVILLGRHLDGTVALVLKWCGVVQCQSSVEKMHMDVHGSVIEQLDKRPFFSARRKVFSAIAAPQKAGGGVVQRLGTTRLRAECLYDRVWLWNYREDRVFDCL